MNDADHHTMLTDPSLVVQAPDGRQQVVVPFRLGGPPTLVRRDQLGILRAYHPLITGGIPCGVVLSPTTIGNKKMPPPNAIPQMRISSNGGMRPPSTAPNHHTNGSLLPSPHPLPVPHHSGASRAAISMPHVDLSNPDSTPIPIQADQAKKEDVDVTIKPPASSPSPTRLPAHGQTHPGLAVPTNGFHLTPMSSHAAAALANVQRASQPNERGLTMQQLQELKSVFANLPAADQLAMLQANSNRAVLGNVPMPNGNNVNVNGNVNGIANGSHMQQLAAGGHMNLKLPVSRQMQVNGQTAGVNKPGVNGQMAAIPTNSASPPLQAAPSPSRAASMTMTSPSLQHQQPAGNTQGSY
jgi:enhancer of polycomb-like protein